MNYCNPNWNGNGNLSAEDVQTIQQMYGAPGSPNASAFDLEFPHIARGDCELDKATLTFAPDGNASWNANVKTNHTHSGDYWHAKLTLRDQSGNTIATIPEFTSMRMSDDHGYYTWTHAFTFSPVLFTDIKSGHLNSSC